MKANIIGIQINIQALSAFIATINRHVAITLKDKRKNTLD